MVAKYKKGDFVIVKLTHEFAVRSGIVHYVYFQEERDGSKTEMVVLVNIRRYNGMHHIRANYVEIAPTPEAKYSIWEY